jgi:Cft2 family RNA processing exonuclease
MRVEFTSEGIRLPEIGLWLDPAIDAEAAWVSHGHSDHARGRHRIVIATPETIEFYRLGFPDAAPRLCPLAYGESLQWNGARLTAYPAGHMLGAAQLLVERGGERLLYTGDIKLSRPLCGREAEIVRADRLIVESTFGLPVFRFLSRDAARGRILSFARRCFVEGAVPAFLAHRLGRGQEVLSVLCEAGIPVAVHEALARFLPVYERRGFRFPGWTPFEGRGADGQALMAVRGFRPAGLNLRVAYVSGRAALAEARERTGADELIAYSDHADCEELLALVDATGAAEVDVVHGYAESFARLLAGGGLTARAHREPFPNTGGGTASRL